MVAMSKLQEDVCRTGVLFVSAASWFHFRLRLVPGNDEIKRQLACGNVENEVTVSGPFLISC